MYDFVLKNCAQDERSNGCYFLYIIFSHQMTLNNLYFVARYNSRMNYFFKYSSRFLVFIHDLNVVYLPIFYRTLIHHTNSVKSLFQLYLNIWAFPS